MPDRRWSAWLHRAGEESIAIPSRGLVLGRRPDCDIVLASGRASQVQAMLTPTLEGLELLSLGRNPTRVDGEEVKVRTLLEDNATVQVPGTSFTVELAPRSAWSRAVWSVVPPSGHAYSLRRLPFRIGGSATDHLRLLGWPDGAVELLAADGGVAIEFHADGRLNDSQMAQGAVEMMRDDDHIEFAGTAVQARSTAGKPRATTVLLGQDGVRELTFTFLPTGARLDIQFAGEDQVRQVVLSELRARFVGALLQPPRGYTAGDLIPDDVLIPAIWSANSQRTRVDVNVLIYRTRRFLLKNGINPDRLFARARLGGSTRVLLLPGSKATVV